MRYLMFFCNARQTERYEKDNEFYGEMRTLNCYAYIIVNLT